LGIFSPEKVTLLKLAKCLLGYILVDFFTTAFCHPGTDVIIFKIFSPKNLPKIMIITSTPGLRQGIQHAASPKVIPQSHKTFEMKKVNSLQENDECT
jgi:uncharacterized membrane protein